MLKIGDVRSGIKGLDVNPLGGMPSHLLGRQTTGFLV